MPPTAYESRTQSPGSSHDNQSHNHNSTSGGDPAAAYASQKPDPRPGENSAFGWNDNGTGEGGPMGEGHPDRNSDEWKQHRKNNHKEVERRRRETINEGITELKKIVPGTEKNKGEILKQAVRYIQALKDSEAENMEKWALEKLVVDQALRDQSAKLAKLSRDYGRLEAENESLKRWIIELGEKTSTVRKVEEVTEAGPSKPELRSLGFASSSTSKPQFTRHDSEPNESPRSDSRHPSADHTPLSSLRDQSEQVTEHSESNIHHLLRSASEITTGLRKRESSKEPPSLQYILENDRLTVKKTKLV
ncbi:hypothetical protein CROQUDRAFT_47897 [Cronartium quercuum f. sp. fusiforme G11]|uniref:BHLH domain-containing protein n=1 Tax=Cronartium quercuum f. sp. fusiforme G11 TaxID=708437 RepID=A0A9P6TAW7_9BASI|nr:hypothetical protein CROQUDRAFT_47897 [Cronartium quercuum f. sp. fusiforme G11]